MANAKRKCNPRVERVPFTCRACHCKIMVLPSTLRGGARKYCSRTCSNEQSLKPESKANVLCDSCGLIFTKRSDHIFTKNFCSKSCHVESRRLPDAKWRNKDYIKAYMKKYASEHKDYWRAKSREYNKLHPDRKAATQRNRRASVGNISPEQWVWLQQLFEFRCACCLANKPLELDHIVPIYYGGANVLENAQPLCRTCNSSKSIQIVDYRPLCPILSPAAKIELLKACHGIDVVIVRKP